MVSVEYRQKIIALALNMILGSQYESLPQSLGEIWLTPCQVELQRILCP